jgi:tRNA 2-thiouridine synthesizing protein C
MNSHFFLLGGTTNPERLSWLEGLLKFFFVKIAPESLLHHAKKGEAIFTIFVTGDALYSLHDPETLLLWDIILSLPSVKIICDRLEMDMRGLSVEPLKMKYMDQLVDHNSLALNGKLSFWKDVMKLARQNEQPVPSTVGYLQLESPYMHRSSLNALRCLNAALEVHSSVELYAYLDGVHLGHTGQNPTENENIGVGLEGLSERLTKLGLQCQMIACSRCATARGYSTWDDGQGAVISTCAIKPYRIRDMNAIVDQFKRNHIILGENSASLLIRHEGTAPLHGRADKSGQSPPITIFITKNPYGTEYTHGALSLASACAHHGIATKVIFIEDGVYALSGTHEIDPEAKIFNVQEVIDVIAGNEKLQMYGYTPSLQKRNVAKNRKLTAVLDIGIQELGQLLFTQPSGVLAEHQRVFFF